MLMSFSNNVSYPSTQFYFLSLIYFEITIFTENQAPTAKCWHPVDLLFNNAQKTNSNTRAKMAPGLLIYIFETNIAKFFLVVSKRKNFKQFLNVHIVQTAPIHHSHVYG